MNHTVPNPILLHTCLSRKSIADCRKFSATASSFNRQHSHPQVHPPPAPPRHLESIKWPFRLPTTSIFPFPSDAVPTPTHLSRCIIQHLLPTTLAISHLSGSLPSNMRPTTVGRSPPDSRALSFQRHIPNYRRFCPLIPQPAPSTLQLLGHPIPPTQHPPSPRLSHESRVSASN